ncbi:MAG: hypothetical protein GEU90_02935 [Gemmatimonas sp.]|nr:hypothetical protein [Gemmatimonas sp.]
MRFARQDRLFTKSSARVVPILVAALSFAGCATSSISIPSPASQPASGPDARVGLQGGYQDAQEAVWNLEMISHEARPPTFSNPDDPADFNFANTDLAFRGDHVFIGSYNGLQIYNISDPIAPRLRTAFVCPGGQGDVSIHGDLLFMSVEEQRGRVNCAADSVGGAGQRFQGVRIFDVSNLDEPRQVGAVQTCRGSHTHTLVTDPDDLENVYVYVSGTGQVRSETEMPGCLAGHWTEDPNTAYWRIEVIQVPIGAPEEAQIVSTPRIFADSTTGAIGGLWEGGTHGPGTQETAQTNSCHDITVFPEIELGAGACSGNGILLDISDPVNPVRIAEVTDPNFAYWHSATFNKDGTKVIFTDEWGGGAAPRCRATDPETWGANAIFDIVDRELRFASYYKLPAPQSALENCVAHNGSLIPVPGRDIMVQAWYQGGISVFDFTDSASPFEIAYFDRGPLDPDRPTLAGYWSAYWYNGAIYGTEIARGLDVFRLTPSESLSGGAIEAAEQVEIDSLNPQLQTRASGGR